jgi:hypothetical protein
LDPQVRLLTLPNFGVNNIHIYILFCCLANCCARFYYQCWLLNNGIYQITTDSGGFCAYNVRKNHMVSQMHMHYNKCMFDKKYSSICWLNKLGKFQFSCSPLIDCFKYVFCKRFCTQPWKVISFWYASELRGVENSSCIYITW